MSKDDDLLEVIGAIGLGILGGVALAELLKKLSEKKCPYCNNINEADRQHCKYCGGRLQ
jgi:hypothetical protein